MRQSAKVRAKANTATSRIRNARLREETLGSCGTAGVETLFGGMAGGNSTVFKSRSESALVPNVAEALGGLTAFASCI